MASRAVPTPSREAFFVFQIVCYYYKMKFPVSHVGEFGPIERSVINRYSTVTGDHIGRFEERLAELPLPDVYDGLWRERNRINEQQFTQLSGMVAFVMRLLWIEHGMTLVERMARKLGGAGVPHDIYKNGRLP